MPAHALRALAVTLHLVPKAAPRLPPVLLDEIERLAPKEIGIAEIARRVGALAERQGLTRPSYEQVRTHVHRAVERARRRGPTLTDVALDVAFRVRPPEAILDQISGVGVPPLRR